MTHPTRYHLAVRIGLIGMIALTAASTRARDLATMTFESEAVGRTMAFDVLLPSHYQTSQARYPVLYLLHGHGGHHRVWDLLATATDDPRWPDDLIIVMPDAGNSWYLNWDQTDNRGSEVLAKGAQAKNHWEDYIVTDLIDHVDSTFRTIPARAGRAISGFSMGGYGAFVLGLRHADRFISVASISGYLDYARTARRRLESGPRTAPRRRARPAALAGALEAARTTPNLAIAVKGFQSRAERTPSGRSLTTVDAARAHDPFVLVGGLVRSRAGEQQPYLHLACGTEDSLFGFTRELAEILLARRIPFGYWQASGKHDADFRSRALARLVPQQYGEMLRTLAETAEETK